jgi:two-component system sensor histidine kinase KdpD
MASTTNPISDLRHLLKSWGSAVLLLIAATTGGFLLDHHVSLTSQAMVYVLAVVIASYSLRWQHSVACAIGAVAAFNFFLCRPAGRWRSTVKNT